MRYDFAFMTIYQFEFHDQDAFCDAGEGMELADEAAARREALLGVRSILAEEVSQGRLDLNGYILIRNSDGKELFTLAFADALDIELTGDRVAGPTAL